MQSRKQSIHSRRSTLSSILAVIVRNNIQSNFLATPDHPQI